MHRVASILLAAGVVLLTTWVVAPAAPSPSPLPAHTDASLDQSAPIVAEVVAQVDRLRSRVEEPQGFPPPERNPFSFGAHPEPPARIRPVMSMPVEPPPPPAPVLPKILAIIANEVDGGVTHNAVFSTGEDVLILKVGDVIGPFTIRSIAADVVELVDASGVMHRLPLR